MGTATPRPRAAVSDVRRRTPRASARRQDQVGVELLPLRPRRLFERLGRSHAKPRPPARLISDEGKAEGADEEEGEGERRVKDTEEDSEDIPPPPCAARLEML